MEGNNRQYHRPLAKHKEKEPPISSPVNRLTLDYTLEDYNILSKNAKEIFSSKLKGLAKYLESNGFKSDVIYNDKDPIDFKVITMYKNKDKNTLGNHLNKIIEYYFGVGRHSERKSIFNLKYNIGS